MSARTARTRRITEASFGEADNAGASFHVLVESPERLWRLLVARTGPRMLGVYLAHLMLCQVDWSIRFHGRDAVARWVGHADGVLTRLSAEPEQGGVG